MGGKRLLSVNVNFMARISFVNIRRVEKKNVWLGRSLPVIRYIPVIRVCPLDKVSKQFVLHFQK